MNIFEDSKFGDVFITKHKRTARFICHHPQSGTYSLWLVDTDKVFHYKPDGTCVQGEELNITAKHSPSLADLRARFEQLHREAAQLYVLFADLCLNACEAPFNLTPTQSSQIDHSIRSIFDSANHACQVIDTSRS